MEGQFTRQETLGINQNQCIGVVGVGGVGSWVALELALAGVRELHLFDSDTVSSTNLNRIAIADEFIGQNKALACLSTIRRFRKDAFESSRLHAHTNFNVLPAISKHYPKFDWLIVATDTGKSRDEVSTYAKKNGIAYLELGAEGHMATLTGSPGDWETAHEQDPGYASVPVWVGPAVLAATMACYHVLLGEQATPVITIRQGWEHAASGLEQPPFNKPSFSFKRWRI